MKAKSITIILLLLTSVGAMVAPAGADHDSTHYEGSLVVEDTVAAHPGYWEHEAEVNQTELTVDSASCLDLGPACTDEGSEIVWLWVKNKQDSPFEISIASEGDVVGGMDVFERFTRSAGYSTTPDCVEEVATPLVPEEGSNLGETFRHVARVTIGQHHATTPEGLGVDSSTTLLPDNGDQGYLVAIYVRAGVQGSSLEYDISVDSPDDVIVIPLDEHEYPGGALGLPYNHNVWVDQLFPCADSHLQPIVDEVREILENQEEVPSLPNAPTTEQVVDYLFNTDL